MFILKPKEVPYKTSKNEKTRDITNLYSVWQWYTAFNPAFIHIIQTLLN